MKTIINNTVAITCITLLFSCEQKPKATEGIADETPAIPSEIVTRSAPDNLVPTQEESWEIESQEGQNLVFSNGETVQTELYELEYFGKIEAKGKAPFLIVAGRGCDECDENIAIYLHSPDSKTKLGETVAIRYPYPGKELDYEDGSLLNDVRFFFGEVLPGINGAIWYQKTKVDGRLMDNAYLVTVEKGEIKGSTLLKKDMPDINKTLELVSEEKALEVPGVEYYSEP
ncbi:hypothetical protein R9C00_13550 [Flammeovirgaceae bacterium SG7u.111]|nr:hypothetical protein [Flammeovirgaceae bacterium SG7u.132]WPO38483.1 hypothetical protein R9C00_13550 [Flammeovirgaceae bacterium SG7u.111]